MKLSAEPIFNAPRTAEGAGDNHSRTVSRGRKDSPDNPPREDAVYLPEEIPLVL